MAAKLYVGKLPYATTEDQLKTMFGAHGTVVSAQVITDRDTGQSKGFAFVEMETEEAAQEAIKALDNSEVDGRNIVVNIARPKEDRPAGGGSRRDVQPPAPLCARIRGMSPRPKSPTDPTLFRDLATCRWVTSNDLIPAPNLLLGTAQ